MAYSITEALNKLNELGVFSYVLPFLIVFSIVFGLLQKTKVFGQPNEAKGVNIVIALAVGLISLMFDVVPTFFATIFPKFGVGLAVFLVLIILLGFFLNNNTNTDFSKLSWIGWVIGIGVIIWAFNEWNWFGGFGGGFGFFLQEYLILIIVLVLVIFAIIAVIGGFGGGSSAGKKPSSG